MADHELSPSELIQALRLKQRKHAAQVAKLERTATRLERRTAKIHVLEAAIADLERRLAEPRRQHRAPIAASPDGTARHARLIFNPSSGPDPEHNAERLAQIVTALRMHGIEPHVGLKTSGATARKLALESARAGHPLVVVAAGDGTIADVASQLVGTPTALAIVPIGTMNNVARSLGVPLGIDDACALIGMGTTRHIDLGRLVSNSGTLAEYFIECAGVGLSAVAALTGQNLEKHHWRIVPGALRRLFESKPGTITVEMDGTRIEASTRLVTVANAPLMGSNLLAAPGAKMDDGQLDVQIYDGMGQGALTKHFLIAASGKADGVRTFRTRHVRITADAPVLTNADTRVTGPQYVVDIEVVPRALSMIVGNGIALSVPVESAPPAPTFAPRPPLTNGMASATERVGAGASSHETPHDGITAEPPIDGPQRM